MIRIGIGSRGRDSAEAVETIHVGIIPRAHDAPEAEEMIFSTK